MNPFKALFAAVLLGATGFFAWGAYWGAQVRWLRSRVGVEWSVEDESCLKVAFVGTLLCGSALWALLEGV